MNCACGQARPEGAKFCPECGAAFAPRCASCGAELTPAAKFCAECGVATKAVGGRGSGAGQEISSQPTPDPRTPTPGSARKVVTIIFADLMGSTALQEGLDPESVNRVMDAYYQAVRGPVEAAGGTVVQLLGDGVLCAFGIPTIAEDDALRAVRAAMGVQQAFREFLGTQQWLSVPIGLRVAVNTGEVVVSDEHPAGIGDPLNVAARLQQEARDGEVLIGQTTRRLVAGAVTLEQAGVFALKGRAETVTAYRVLSLERPTGAAASAFVGRDDELARLTAVYETAVTTPAARLAVLVGSPGLGKSRLIEEVARRLADDATVITAHCDAVGGATFAPIAAALRGWLSDRSDPSDPTDPSDQQSAIAAALPADAPEHARIIAGITALLAGSPASPEETFFVIRRLLTALAQSRPVVLVIDDLHWAEPLLLDLVEHLIQWGSGVPLFVLIGARPELRNLRSSLVTPSGLVSAVVTLAGLDAGAAMRLAANVIGASDLPAAVAAKVLATSEGNPLFVGELVRMLVDEGAIERQGERWVVGANLAALEMPPTIHALLAARIERLRPEERAVLERAAVVGRHFSRGAVSALLGRNGNELDALLEALRRSELIERDTGWFLGEPVLRFHHVLIRDAAYRRLLKGTRAELHERLADWIESHTGDVAEHDEIIGWHLEQAHQHLREIGPMDAKGRGLGERASQHLAAAGRRALGRDDLPVAANLLGRAIDRLDAGDTARADLALDWCEALLSAGDVATAAKAIDELARFAEDRGLGGYGVGGLGITSDSSLTPNPLTPNPLRLRAWHTCFTAQLTVLTAPQGLQTAADSVAAAAQQLAALGDAGGEAKAHSVHATALARLGKVGACEAALDQALAAARRGGDRRRANAVLAGAPLAALWGPSPVTRASGRCLDVVRVLRITQGAPAVESVALSCQGVLEALRGRTEAARRMLASSRKMVEDLGIAHRLFEADTFAGRIAAMEGDDATAERLLRGAYDGLRDLGLGIDAARAGAMLARTLLSQDRIDEAEMLSHQSEALAGDDLQAAIAWRGVRAEALAQRGEHAAAIELAKAAVAIAGATDALLDHADARVALAVALRAAGRGAEAEAEERRAIELWEAKGATLLIERASTKSRPVKPTNVKPMPQPGSVHAESARSGRRVRPNTATAMVARLVAAVAARDFDGITRETPEDFESIDHPSGSSYGREAVVASLRLLFRSRDAHYDVEPLATLGELLVLGRRRTRASGTEGSRYDVGPYENEAFELFEANTDGKSTRTEVFAADHLGDAITRLYQRYADLLPEGPERERAVATARSVAGWNGPIGPDRLATTVTPSMELVDHRNLGTWSTRGAAEFLDHTRLQTTQLAIGFTGRTDGVLALAPDALLVRSAYFGIARDSGGAFENVLLQLFAFGADGLIARSELWEPDHDDEALARFDALTADAGHVCTLAAGIQEGGADSRPKIAGVMEGSRLLSGRCVRPNAASAMQDRFDLALAARDFDGIAAVFDASHQEIDHPTGSTYGRDAGIASLQRLFRSRDPYYHVEPLGTLGELLLLVRRRSGASGATRGNYDVGAYENEAIQLFEVNEAGLCCRAEVFAAERLGEAITRLYERYAELLPDGPERIRAAATARSVAVWNGPIDPERLATAMASSVENADHRRFGTWSARGPEDYIRHWRLQDELAAGWTLRDDAVLAIEANAFLVRRAYFGTVRSTGGAFENLILALFVFGSDGLTTRTEIWEPACETEALARFEEIAGGAETEARSDPFANAATRAVDRGTAALAVRDWEGFAELFAEGARHFDRTRIAQLESDMREWLVSFRQIVEMTTAPPTQTLVATRGERLALFRMLWQGAEGDIGPSEIDWLLIVEVNVRGEHVAIVVYDPEDLDAAYAELDARFAARDPSSAGRTSPPAARAQSNLASVFMERGWAAFDLVDLDDAQQALDAARAHFSPDFVWEDRRPIVGLSGGLDLMLASARERLASGARHQRRTIVGTAGDRVAVGRILWAGGPPDGRFEVEFLAVHEVNEAGLCTALIFFDPDDERAAQREAWARWAAIDPAVAPWVELANEYTEAWNGHDRAQLRACFADDFVLEDHRHAGLGRIEGAEAYVDSNVVLWDLAPDQRAMLGWSWPVVERHGIVLTGRRGGTLPDGGAFANDYAMIFLATGGRFTRWELFEIDALDRALARFEELRSDAPQRFANAATATVAPVIAHIVAHDWQGFEQLFAASFRMSDRRRVVQLDLDRDQYVAFTREIADGRAIRAQSEIVATRGERLALTRSTFEFTDGNVGPSEVAFLLLTQVDARGRIVAYVRWDLEDLGAARAELDARWAAHGAAEHPRASKWLAGYLHAFAVRDWTAMAALLTPDLVGENHRLVGWGTRHGPAGVVSTLQAQIDLAPDTLERVDHVRTCDGAVLLEYAWHGTLEGGAFENVWLVLVELAGDGRAGRADVWEPDQLDQAHARFAELALSSPRSGRIEGIAARDVSGASAFARSEELRPDPLRIPPNAATRTWDRWYETGAAGNWEAHRALNLPSYRVDDRRRLVRMVIDLEAVAVNYQHVFSEGWRPSKTLLATAGDRLALQHLLWTTGEAGAVSEVEMLSLDEVDAQGRFVWSALFDPDERAAAEAELFERYVAGGGDGMPRGMTEYFRGVNTGDLARARTGLCDDFVLEDRRRTGMGRLEGGDAYIASIAAAHELTRERHVRLLYTAAIAPHGRVVMIRAAGTNTEGGAFETYCAALVLYRDERIASFEFFEPEELDVALARLDAHRS